VCRPAPRVLPKILFGGHLPASLRRAARLGDGWIAGPVGTFDELAGLIGELRRLVEDSGRRWDSFEVHAAPPPRALGADAYRRLSQLGVTDAMVLPIDAGGELLIDEPTRQRLSGRPVPEAADPAELYATDAPTVKLQAVQRFAERVIAGWS
jgi:alkanesulfonate monooxygenase SsuD/methylene tetrahydromethanopterin reductase-like flavin-dependent oxidoreductase (luciferase family)